MQKYFEKFPTIEYNNYKVKNISIRTKILERVYNRSDYYNTYELLNSVRPDNVSAEFYRDPYFSWLIYLSNETVDPYYDWKLSQYDFNNFILTKYGTIGDAQGKVSYWMNNWYDNTDPISKEQYESYQDNFKKYYRPIYSGNAILEYRRKETDWSVNTNEIWEYTVVDGKEFEYDQKITIVTSGGDAIANAQVMFSNSTLVRVQHVFGAGQGQIPLITPTSVGVPQAVSNGNYSIAFTLPTGSYPVGVKYSVENDTNSDYNGVFEAYASTNTSITLIYPTNPGLSVGDPTLTPLPYIGYQIEYPSEYPRIIAESISHTSNIIKSKLIAQNITAEERSFWSPITYYDVEDIKNTKNQNIRLLSNNHAVQAALELQRLLNR